MTAAAVVITASQALVFALLLLVAGGVLGGWLWDRSLEADAGGWLEQVTAERVVLHTTDGQSYDGLLLSVHGDGLVLRGAVLVDSDTPLAGDTFVPRDKVLLLQRPINPEGGAS